MIILSKRTDILFALISAGYSVYNFVEGDLFIGLTMLFWVLLWLGQFAIHSSVEEKTTE